MLAEPTGQNQVAVVITRIFAALVLAIPLSARAIQESA
jgi:hypothetical protein